MLLGYYRILFFLISNLLLELPESLELYLYLVGLGVPFEINALDVLIVLAVLNT